MKLKDGQWAGQPCFVVGGGESLKGFSWDLLRGKGRIIVINAAFANVPWADVWFSEDLRVLDIWGKWPSWQAFRGVKLFHALDPAFRERALAIDPSLEVIDRKRHDKYWSRSLADGLSLSSNSGVGAINLAWILGADPIHLLGFDCRSSGKTESNFHDLYERAGFDRTCSSQYKSFASDFANWVEIHTRDRKIYNLVTEYIAGVPSSALDCWPCWERESYLREGRPSKVWVRFKKEHEVRFSLDMHGSGG